MLFALLERQQSCRDGQELRRGRSCEGGQEKELQQELRRGRGQVWTLARAVLYPQPLLCLSGKAEQCRSCLQPLCAVRWRQQQQLGPSLLSLKLTKWEDFSWNHEEIINMDRVAL